MGCDERLEPVDERDVRLPQALCDRSIDRHWMMKCGLLAMVDVVGSYIALASSVS